MVKRGQVLWLKLPFGENDDVSDVFHPYLILDIVKLDVLIVDVGQMDTMDKESWNLFHGDTIPVDNDGETVIYKPSFLNTDRKFHIEYFEGLELYMDTQDVLSKYSEISNAFYSKRQKYGTNPFREITFSKERLIELNPREAWENAHQYRLRKYKRTSL